METTQKRVKKKRKAGKNGKVIKTVISAILVVVMIAAIVAANSLLVENSRIVNNIMGFNQKTISSSNVDSTGLDLAYNKSDYTPEEIGAAEDSLYDSISAEGIVLLKNDDQVLPLSKETTFSFFSVNAAKISIGGGMMGGGISLKDAFDQESVKMNDALWQFYSKGDGSEYGLGSGSISYGDSEDFSIKECPLSVLEGNEEVMESLSGTTPVYFLKRVAGEGRDMPRSMYNHADNKEDQAKSYLEPDTTELEILSYLNDNFNEVILVVNSNAALELDWLADFPNIKAVIYAPDGLAALPGILTGTINPSGRTVDTFASDALASPAAQNIGDYAYYAEDGTPTKYNYVSYKEGIYVGYKYYETRYEDVVLGQGNAGEYEYASEVCYPFGYGLSYTTFEWGNQQVTWNDSTCTVTVDVTNTGDVSGKDVVEIFVQSPYTEYDKENHVEKASVQLAGYDKTKELQPGETETVTVTFDEEQLKAYDYTNAKTYILDAGEYYIAAGKNAHDAINNILAAKGKTTAEGMTSDGNQNLASTYTPDIADTDAVTYSVDSYSGEQITNQLDAADGDIACLSRSDWQGTWPEHDGVASSVISTWGNEINGTDAEGNPASYTYYKTIDSEGLAQLDSFDSLSPVDPESFQDEIVYGEKNNLTLIEMRGLDFDDPLWEDLLDQLTPEDYYNTIGISGYGIEFIDSVNMPFCKDADTAAGLIYGGTGKMFPNMMTLAQTWNQDLALEYGTMIGNEAVLGGADGWYAPSMNIHRTPFSGRNGEYYSEDGFLSGTVASLEVKGAASKGLYTYIKHFAFNDQENHRGDRDGQFGLATWLNEQAARELYLLPFEICMKVGNIEQNYLVKNEDGTYKNAAREIPACQAVMTAFNRMGYTWTGGSYPLITGILRNEWAFNGLIITDNANTSLFMDCYQMIEAGGDIKLTSLSDSARFDYDKNDAATYHYGREAMHRLLYTVSNSKAMNGAMPGSVFKNEMLFTEKLKIGINIGCGIGIALLVLFTILRFVKKKEKSKVVCDISYSNE
ncbi:glycoside hydrolase family 3 N-terminal domain-containing protein [Anaerobium acetethylicum]|uniref:Beta-glucosidase n=1 Tax=Anaerobium acetethylicum TaxID=1619234 RepID=A0A1D3TUD1_9FIRM|nr:glycoside hydrolase family 3 N-terminal domain-containing protein [Anaerobium acetethylicum]SCP97690.1 beta-glucosidase [Anaerobium acetethylicum]